MPDARSPEGIETSIFIQRPTPDGPDALRHFIAHIECEGDAGPEEIGSVSGWLGWHIEEDDVHGAADAIDADAARLGAVAEEIIFAHFETFIENVLLIHRMHLYPSRRGHRLSGAVIVELLALLRLDRDSTVVVLVPEPQRAGGGPYEDGPERDRAVARLTHAYSESGLREWRDTGVWWLPLSNSADSGRDQV